MDEQPEVMRLRIEETQAELNDKLETLDHRFGGTVEAVANVVENAVDAVQSVGVVFDIPLQVQRHPWAVFGGSVAVGFLVDRLLAVPTARSSGSEGNEPKREPSWLSEQLGNLRDLALGGLVAAVTDIARQNLPDAGRQWVDKQFDHLTRRPEPRFEGRTPVRAEDDRTGNGRH